MHLDSNSIYKNTTDNQKLIFPIQLRKMTVKETLEYHLKKLFELSKLERAKLEYRVDGSISKDGKPITEKPTYEQKEWFVRKMKGAFY